METKIIFWRGDSLVQSILADLFTFGFLCGSYWFNYHFVNGSYFLNGVILIMLLIFITSKATDRKKTFTSKEKLKKYVEDLT